MKESEHVEILYNVNIRHKETGERLTVQVWGNDPQQATGKLTNSLIGFNLPYAWEGTGPAYRDNKVITR